MLGAYRVPGKPKFFIRHYPAQGLGSRNTGSCGGQGLIHVMGVGPDFSQPRRTNGHTEFALHRLALWRRAGASVSLNKRVASGDVLVRVLELLEGCSESRVQSADDSPEIRGGLLETGDYEALAIGKHASMEPNVVLQSLL